MTVDVVRGDVVLTVSPPRAHDIAMVIEGSGPREDWLRKTVRLMLTAADRLGIPSELVPRLSRRQFLRDWDLDEAPAAAWSALLAVPDDLAAAPLATVSPAPYAQKQEVAASLVYAAAVHAAELAQEAVDSAADRAAEAASTARARRSAAVEGAAQAVAARVAQAASARADVAREAATAAAAPAVAAADAAKIVDLEVMCAAEAVRAVASEAALTLAVQTNAQATAFALAHH